MQKKTNMSTRAELATESRTPINGDPETVQKSDTSYSIIHAAMVLCDVRFVQKSDCLGLSISSSKTEKKRHRTRVDVLIFFVYLAHCFDTWRWREEPSFNQINRCCKRKMRHQIFQANSSVLFGSGWDWKWYMQQQSCIWLIYGPSWFKLLQPQLAEILLQQCLVQKCPRTA